MIKWWYCRRATFDDVATGNTGRQDGTEWTAMMRSPWVDSNFPDGERPEDIREPHLGESS